MERAFSAILAVLAFSPHGFSQQPKPDLFESKSIAEWIAALKDPKANYKAQTVLSFDGPFGNRATTALLEALKGADPVLRAEAARALSSVEPDNAAVLKALVAALADRVVDVRVSAAKSISSFGPNAESAVMPLSLALQDKESRVRKSAANALREIGEKSRPALPQLMEALKDKDESVSWQAACALIALGTESRHALPGLLEALKDPRWSVCGCAALVIGGLGRQAESAVPALINALGKQQDLRARTSIAEALAEIGPGARDAVPILEQALKNDKGSYRDAAVLALGRIGPSAKNAVHSLVSIVESDHALSRLLAIMALGDIGPDASAAVPALLTSLSDEIDSNCRRLAAIALGKIGPGAKAALPMLVKIARGHEPDFDIRQAVTEAALKIDPAAAEQQGIRLKTEKVVLGKLPTIKLAARAKFSEAKVQQTLDLIHKLADLSSADVQAVMTIRFAFVPVADPPLPLLYRTVCKPPPEPNASFRQLVAMGPDALPFLLEHLNDKSFTRSDVGGWWLVAHFTDELWGNPLNLLEKHAISQPAEKEHHRNLNGHYRHRVGDICYAALGQIVNRLYQTDSQWLGGNSLTIHSPVESQAMCRRLRAIWSSPNPDQKLLDSLLLDFATQTNRETPSWEGRSLANSYQPGAAKRLLFYFPRETAPVIADRVKSFDVRKTEWKSEREDRNGVDVIAFVRAVSWCTEPVIQSALDDLFKRSDDAEIRGVIREARGRKRE